MNLRRIEVFVVVANAGGFSAAAARLHVAQSAVSVAIRDLEAELGTQLFVRGPRAVALTDSGRLLLARAEPALRQLRGAADDIRDLDRLAIGHARIAAPAIVTQFMLAQPLADFVAAYPGVQLRMLQGGTRQIEDMVLRGEADLGIVARRDFPPELDSRALRSLDNVAFVPAASPLAGRERLAWRDVLQHPLAVFPPGYHQRGLVEHYARKLRLRPHILVEAENPAVLLAAVRAGSAVTTLPAPAAEGMKGLHAAALPLEQDDRLLIDACWLKAAPLSKAAQALLAHLQAALQARPARQSSARRIKGAIARAAVRRSAVSKPA